MKFEVNNVPSEMIISSKYAIPSLTGTVISSKIEKINDCPPKLPSVDAIGPFLSVKVAWSWY